VAGGDAMILDTCALLFLASGDRRLSNTARERLSSQTSRWFCAISSFEIALKYRQKKLELPFPPARWLQKMSQRYALTEIPLDSALCLAAVALPDYHRDPFDRFIIAAAIRLDVPVVTVDPHFQQYGVEIVS
jgi:PIN domain nuclease of toxin-antitoxin system